MIKILIIYVIASAIILITDFKVIRDLPKINRWFTYIFLLAGMGIFAYTLQISRVVYASVWLQKWLGPLVPF
ncbi:hypothetical protein VQ056_26060 [Paenibacillus sp. JTLBN-2024]|jgi:hypothetical protein|uniref:Uncharacterized protein n=1 Tax=Paenibacillus cookii TaxID=157839 RepID=A0ABQ4M0Y9_9BACL|nr:hypothetical protein [Paenibacillus cookii]KHF37653.1 hypothetical protein CM49_00173 [Paenibacillus sp. P1XP2]GIO68611.1 hypothetical protein J21TS3_34320 [Paenibacillus cookii]HWO53986.1 hypothetical protein [Paenibacillus cookii]